MSALPNFFFITAITGAVLCLADIPYPFPLLGMIVVGASIGGFLFSAAYVHAFMPQEWQRKVAPLRRLANGFDTPLHHSHE
jgi:hypothetical protein